MEVKVYLPSTHFDPVPIAASFPPDTTAKDLVQELSKKFHVKGEDHSLVITPTASTTGGVVDPKTFVKSFNLDIEERLELWKAPFLINILLVSDFSASDPVKQRKEIVFDYGYPLSYNIPLLRRIFSLDEEFVFQYIPSLDEDKKAKWLDSRQSLADQSFEGTSWLMCYPISTFLKIKEAHSRLTETIKEGYLVKQTQKGTKKTPKRKRWVILRDHFLFYYKNKGDPLPAGAIPLEYYTLSMVKIKEQPSLHLKRAIGRFEDGNADLYIMYGEEGEDLGRWKEALQRKSSGSGSTFGVTLDEMMTRPSMKPFIPDIVVILTEYILQKGVDDEGILRISGSNAVVQYYKDQFDRGAEDLDLSELQDVHVVASLLKLYFRELPDPAIPFVFYEEIIRLMNMRGVDKGNDIMPILLEIISKLPDSHFHVLKYMCDFLFEVAQHSAVNLMGLPNLGTVMGPNLLRPPDHKVASFVQDSPLISECIQLLIKHHDQIRKSDNVQKSQPRPAPMRSEDEFKSDLPSPRSSDTPQPPFATSGVGDINATASRPKRFAKVISNNPKQKSEGGKFDILKGGLFMEPIPKQISQSAGLVAPPKPAPHISPTQVMESVLAAHQSVNTELQHHLATNPPSPNITVSPPTPGRPPIPDVPLAPTQQPQQAQHRPLPLPQPVTSSHPPAHSPPPAPPRLNQSSEVPHPKKPASKSPKFPARDAKAEPKPEALDPSKVESPKPEHTTAKEPAKPEAKAEPIMNGADVQPARDASTAPQKNDKNSPMARKLELTTTESRIIPPTFPNKIIAKKAPPATSNARAPSTLLGVVAEHDGRVVQLEEECKTLKQKVEEESFKRKLLELKLELLVQRMNELETKLAAQTDTPQ